MSNSTTYQINLQGNAIEILMQMQGQFNTLNKNVEKVSTSLKSVNMQNLKQGLMDLSAPIQEAFKGVEAFDQKLHELNSVVDISTEAQKQIKQSAIDTSKAFGGSASDTIETYKVLLSKLSPEIAKNPEALRAMGDNVAYATKLMGGDGAGAVSLLTSAMNQYGISLDNPMQASREMTKILDTMQMGAKVGSAELTDLRGGIEEAGSTASAANVKFEELNGLLQLMDKGGKKGAEGGVAVRNMLSIMAQGDLMPAKSVKLLQEAGVNIGIISDKSVPLKQRLNELSKIKDSQSIVGEIFGRENMASGQFLLNNLGLLDSYINQINVSEGVAKASAMEIMASYQETSSRINAWFDNTKLKIFDTFGASVPYLEVFFGKMQSFFMVAPGIMACVTALQSFNVMQKATAIWNGIVALSSEVMAVAFGGATVSTVALQLALDALGIGLIIAAIAGLVFMVKYAWNNFEGFRAFLYGFGSAVKAIFGEIKGIVMDVFGGIGNMISAIVNGDWEGFKDGLSQFAGGVISAYNPFGHVDAVKNAYNTGAEEGRQSFKDSKADPTNATSRTATASTSSKVPTISAKAPNGGFGGGKSAGAGGGVSGGGGGSGQIRNNNIRIDALMKGDIIMNKDALGMSPMQVKEMIVRLLTEAVHDTEIAIS